MHILLKVQSSNLYIYILNCFVFVYFLLCVFCLLVCLFLFLFVVVCLFFFCFGDIYTQNATFRADFKAYIRGLLWVCGIFYASLLQRYYHVQVFSNNILTIYGCVPANLLQTCYRHGRTMWYTYKETYLHIPDLHSCKSDQTCWQTHIFESKTVVLNELKINICIH